MESDSPVLDDDPYAVLHLPRTASQAAITAAYRQLAKILHPDVPETGDEEAFIRLQRAYHLLGDPNRRAAHDHVQRSETRPAWRSTETELSYTRAVAWRWPRFVVPVLAVITALALVQVGSSLTRRTAAPAVLAPPVAGQNAVPVQARPIAAPIVAPLADFAAADNYIAPGPPLPWLNGAARLEAFTPVALIRTFDTDGRAEVRTESGATGLVDAARLLPGDARAARLAACLHLAGATPRSGQTLLHRTNGSARLEITNREDRPAVFKLRDPAGAALATAYLAPRGRAVLENLPPGPHRAEYALGDLWSAACGLFTAGMRAQVFNDPLVLAQAARTSVPGLASTDISDEAFARD